MPEAMPSTHEEIALRRNDVLQVVSFRLGHEEYAIEIQKVKEIILLEGITRVPQMPEFIEGILNLRGLVIPVFDLRKRFGLPEAERSEHSRIVVTRLEGRLAGIIVDAVSQVMKLPRSSIQPPPETIAHFAGSYLQGVGKTQERMLLLLDIERVLQEKVDVSALASGPHSKDWTPAGPPS